MQYHKNISEITLKRDTLYMKNRVARLCRVVRSTVGRNLTYSTIFNIDVLNNYMLTFKMEFAESARLVPRPKATTRLRQASPKHRAAQKTRKSRATRRNRSAWRTESTRNESNCPETSRTARKSQVVCPRPNTTPENFGSVRGESSSTKGLGQSQIIGLPGTSWKNRKTSLGWKSRNVTTILRTRCLGNP